MSHVVCQHLNKYKKKLQNGGVSVINGATTSGFDISQNVRNGCVKIYLKIYFFGQGWRVYGFCETAFKTRGGRILVWNYYIFFIFLYNIQLRSERPTMAEYSLISLIPKF